MLTSPLAHHLIDLGPGDPAAAAPGALTPLGATHSMVKLNAAEATGYARGRGAALVELEQRITTQENNFASESEAARRHWVESESTRFATALSDGLSRLEQDVADGVARTLLPFVTERLRETALDHLAGAAEQLVTDSMPASLEISGPADLTAQLVKRLENLSVLVRIVPGDDVDLRVRADTSVLETRIKEWTARIAKAIA